MSISSVTNNSSSLYDWYMTSKASARKNGSNDDHGRIESVDTGNGIPPAVKDALSREPLTPKAIPFADFLDAMEYAAGKKTSGRSSDV